MIWKVTACSISFQENVNSEIFQFIKLFVYVPKDCNVYKFFCPAFNNPGYNHNVFSFAVWFKS